MDANVQVMQVDNMTTSIASHAGNNLKLNIKQHTLLTSPFYVHRALQHNMFLLVSESVAASNNRTYIVNLANVLITVYDCCSL